MPETLKLPVVNDIHHGPDKMTKAGSAAVPLPKDFTTFAEACPPGFFVELGDRISVIDTATDRQQLRMIATQFADLSAPDLHLLDNHDQVHLSIAAIWSSGNWTAASTTPRGFCPTRRILPVWRPI